MPQCQREREGRECGNKDGGKKKRDGEKELCATINHLLGVQVYLASFFFFLKYTAHRRGAGGWGESEEDRGRKQHEEREKRGERRWRARYCRGKLPG